MPTWMLSYHPLLRRPGLVQRVGCTAAVQDADLCVLQTQQPEPNMDCSGVVLSVVTPT